MISVNDWRQLGVLLSGLVLLAGCDRISLPSRIQDEEKARAAEQAGEFPQAVRMYEGILDGTAKTAEIHYKLGLIYDDKLNDPVSALHHYRRFLRMSETEEHKSDVQEYVERIELLIATRAAEGGVMTKREAVRLKNENLELHEQITKLRGELAEERKKPKAPSTPVAAKASPPRDSQGFSTNPATAAAERAIGAETRTYTVQKGDTLASIARRFYNNANRWKDIADANHNLLNGSVNLQIGQVLVIPE